MSAHIPTEADKEKMQQGARAMRAVESYLDFINTDKPRGRKPDPAKIQAKIDGESNLAKKVILISQLHDALARDELEQKEAELEEAFVKYAPWFSEQHGITYNAWREIGVQATILSKAGITS